MVTEYFSSTCGTKMEPQQIKSSENGDFSVWRQTMGLLGCFIRDLTVSVQPWRMRQWKRCPQKSTGSIWTEPNYLRQRKLKKARLGANSNWDLHPTLGGELQQGPLKRPGSGSEAWPMGLAGHEKYGEVLIIFRMTIIQESYVEKKFKFNTWGQTQTEILRKLDGTASG